MIFLWYIFTYAITIWHWQDVSNAQNLSTLWETTYGWNGSYCDKTCQNVSCCVTKSSYYNHDLISPGPVSIVLSVETSMRHWFKTNKMHSPVLLNFDLIQYGGPMLQYKSLNFKCISTNFFSMVLWPGLDTEPSLHLRLRLTGSTQKRVNETQQHFTYHWCLLQKGRQGACACVWGKRNFHEQVK